jgi:hypothetical protein
MKKAAKQAATNRYNDVQVSDAGPIGAFTLTINGAPIYGVTHLSYSRGVDDFALIELRFYARLNDTAPPNRTRKARTRG